MLSRWRRFAFFVLGVALSGGFLFFSMRDVRFADALAEIARVPVIVVVADPLLRLAMVLVAALRSRLIFGPVHRFSVRRLFESVWLAMALNNTVPLRAGEVARIGFLARYGGLPVSTCLAAVAVERVLDMLALVVIVVATVPFLAGGLPLGASFYAVAAIVAVAILGAVVVSRRPDGFQRLCRGVAGLFGARVREFVVRRSEAFARGLEALGSASAVLGVMVMTFAFWGLGMAAIQLWLWAFGLALPWYAPAVVLGFLSFGLAIPATPGNVGTFHFFVSSAVIYLGGSATQAVSLALAFHAVAVVPLTVLGLPLLFREYSRLRAVRAEPRREQSESESV